MKFCDVLAFFFTRIPIFTYIATMFPSSGYFNGIDCPFFTSGLCERPWCHFRHVKNDEKGKISLSASGLYLWHDMNCNNSIRRTFMFTAARRTHNSIAWLCSGSVWLIRHRLQSWEISHLVVVFIRKVLHFSMAHDLVGTLHSLLMPQMYK